MLVSRQLLKRCKMIDKLGPDNYIRDLNLRRNQPRSKVNIFLKNVLNASPVKGKTTLRTINVHHLLSFQAQSRCESGYRKADVDSKNSSMPTLFEVKDKVIAITGGSGGIGFATAELLVSQGAKVSIADVSAQNLQDAEARLKQAAYSGEYMTAVVDVRKPQQVNDWIAKTVERFGKLHGGVNLAGVIPKNINIDRVEEMPDEDWQFVIDVNLNGGMSRLFSE